MTTDSTTPSDSTKDTEPTAAKAPKATRPDLPRGVVSYLWARSAGRCAFPGCNEPLWKDLLTGKRLKVGEIAHIVSWSPTGPRGDADRSLLLATDVENLMLVCEKHNKLVDDRNRVDEYPEEQLLDYKRRHEERIERLTAIHEDRCTKALFYQAPIGGQREPVDTALALAGIAAAERYAQDPPHLINGLDIPFEDGEEQFWTSQAKLLRQRMEQLRSERDFAGFSHLSVCALAPIPLLMLLGREIGSTTNAHFHNLHRTPKGWHWPRDSAEHVHFELLTPETDATTASEVAMLLSVSGEVLQDQAQTVLAAGTPIYQLRASVMLPDCIRYPEEVDAFGHRVLQLTGQIHRACPNAVRVHVFAALPVALAVKFGHVLLQKLHTPYVLHDLNRKRGLWGRALELGSAA
jgi:hypothetical protein